MKRYTFLTENDTLIGEVVAENHDEAVYKYQSWGGNVDYKTDFYSETIEHQGLNDES